MTLYVKRPGYLPDFPVPILHVDSDELTVYDTADAPVRVRMVVVVVLLACVLADTPC